MFKSIKKHWKKIVLGLILVAIFAYLTKDNFCWLLENGNDLFLNLLSEIVGIVLTVFFVDKIIKYREDKKWEPVPKNQPFFLLQMNV